MLFAVVLYRYHRTHQWCGLYMYDSVLYWAGKHHRSGEYPYFFVA